MTGSVAVGIGRSRISGLVEKARRAAPLSTVRVG